MDDKLFGELVESMKECNVSTTKALILALQQNDELRKEVKYLEAEITEMKWMREGLEK